MIREVAQIPEQRIAPQVIHKRSSSVAPVHSKFASTLAGTVELKSKLTNLYPDSKNDQSYDYGEGKFATHLKLKS